MRQNVVGHEAAERGAVECRDERHCDAKQRAASRNGVQRRMATRCEAWCNDAQR
jgi:hypothetical protein